MIRAFARSKTETKRFDQATDDLSQCLYSCDQSFCIIDPGYNHDYELRNYCTLLLWRFQSEHRKLGTGEVLALVNYMNQNAVGTDRCIESRHHFTRAAASASRINEVLDTEPSIDDSLSEVLWINKTGRCPSFRTCGLSLFT